MFLSNLLKCMSRCQNRKNYRVPSFLTRHSVNLPSIWFPRTFCKLSLRSKCSVGQRGAENNGITWCKTNFLWVVYDDIFRHHTRELLDRPWDRKARSEIANLVDSLTRMESPLSSMKGQPHGCDLQRQGQQFVRGVGGVGGGVSHGS